MLKTSLELGSISFQINTFGLLPSWQTQQMVLCKLLAQAYVEAFKARPPLRDVDVSEWREMMEATTEKPDLGTRAPVPEVGSNWGPLDRWSQVARWRFKKEEHKMCSRAEREWRHATWPRETQASSATDSS